MGCFPNRKQRSKITHIEHASLTVSKGKQTMILALKLKLKYSENASGSGRLIHTFVAFKEYLNVSCNGAMKPHYKTA